MSERIVGTKVRINEEAVTRFFEDRAARYSDEHPVVSVLYQDANPALAESRDLHEKSVALPLLNLSPSDRVLDIGCGIGRWADALIGKVAKYHGTDLIDHLVTIAQERFKDQPGFSFQALRAQDVRAAQLTSPPPYDVVIVAGLFPYINDADCQSILANAAECCSESARMFIREPVGIEKRLTLDRIWSEDLKHEYSAIYRTADEFITFFDAALAPAGFVLTKQAPLLPPELTNRKETTQHYFVLERRR